MTSIYLLIFGIFIYFCFDICILGCIIPYALWKIFQKAGEKGWKSIIPIYNMFIVNKFLGISPWFVSLSLISFILIIPYYGNSLLVLLRDYGVIVLVCVNIYVNYKLAKSFGKKWTFTLGLIFASFIFYPILAFGNSQYIGPNNYQMQESNSENTNFNSQIQNTKNVKTKKLLIFFIIFIVVIFLSCMEIFNYSNYVIRDKINDYLREATLLIYSKKTEVKYGQIITLNDFVETNKLPKNITVTISINNKKLLENQTFKFDKLGTYKIDVLIEYSDGYIRILRKGNPYTSFSLNIVIKNIKDPVIIDMHKVTESITSL